jgi:2',3'-cyclic-nucleotide 2'-phosphodiesterase (5'-nucleotidase family)
MLAVALPAMAEEALPLAGTLVILHTNDIHGQAVADLDTGAMGYQSIAKVKDDYEALGASVLLLDAGDASQGTPLVNLVYGKTAFEFMNEVGYDAMAPGNHEFDWGQDNLYQNAEVANFPILAANITRTIDGTLVFQPNAVFDFGFIKVGVFGLATPETLTKAHPDGVAGLHFAAAEELYAVAQAQIDELTAAGATFIIGLGHLGIDDESVTNRSIDVIANTTGIDLFIDGHSHSVIEGESVGESETVLVSTGSLSQNIGIVETDGEYIATSLKALDTLLYYNTNEYVAGIVNSQYAIVQEELGKAFATTEVLLNGERSPGVRTEETNLGDFAADSILYGAKKYADPNVVAAVTNGGGIRTSIQIGDITMNDMKTVFPFGNVVATLTVTGAELLEALEAATCTTPDAIGAFPQVSGIVFTIDTSVPYEQGEMYPNSTYYAPAKPGSRVTIESVGGEPWSADALYVIATNDFTAAGGDTYYAFGYAYDTAGIETGLSLEDALIEYVAEVLGGVVGEQYAQPAGRITIK